jgi:hypothetical protein
MLVRPKHAQPVVQTGALAVEDVKNAQALSQQHLLRITQLTHDVGPTCGSVNLQ